MPFAHSYIRFSTKKQLLGNSYERQRAKVLEWVEQHPEYELSDLTFEDLGKSGHFGEHIKEGGGWAKLLAAVQSGAIRKGDCVLVEAIDRTGRLPPLEMVEILSPIIRNGVTIITLDDNIQYTEASLEGGHLFLLAAKIQQAYAYSKTLGERIAQGYALRKEKAKKGDGAKRHTPIWLTSSGELVEDVAPWIVKAFRWYIDGIGKSEIARRLRESGVDRLSRCSAPSVDSWLQHPTAIGNWGDIPDVYPAVVDRETWLLAQEQRKKAIKAPRTRVSSHFLTGLVKCSVCGGNYTMHSKDGKPFAMRCVKHHLSKGGDCTNNSSIPKEVVDWVRLGTSTAPAVHAITKQRVSDNELELLELRSSLDKINQKIAGLVELVSVVGDVAGIAPKIKEAQAEKEEAERQIAVLERGIHTEQGSWVDMRKADELYTIDSVRLNALLQSVGYTITISPDKEFSVAWDGQAQDEQFSGKYLGPKRLGNSVVGWKVSLTENAHASRETVIEKGEDEYPIWVQKLDFYLKNLEPRQLPEGEEEATMEEWLETMVEEQNRVCEA